MKRDLSLAKKSKARRKLALGTRFPRRRWQGFGLLVGSLPLLSAAFLPHPEDAPLVLPSCRCLAAYRHSLMSAALASHSHIHFNQPTDEARAKHLLIFEVGGGVSSVTRAQSEVTTWGKLSGFTEPASSPRRSVPRWPSGSQGPGVRLLSIPRAQRAVRALWGLTLSLCHPQTTFGTAFPAAGPGGAPSGRCRGSPWGRPRCAQPAAGPRWASGDRTVFLGSRRELPRSLFTRGETEV